MSGQKTRTEKLKQKNGNLHLQLCQDNKRHVVGEDDDDDDDDDESNDDDDDDDQADDDDGDYDEESPSLS